MSRVSDNDSLELKKRSRRRLVGAAALALLAVIILPIVMDAEPEQPVSEIQVSIPERALDSTPIEPLPAIIPPPIGAMDQLPAEVEQTVRPVEVTPPEPAETVAKAEPEPEPELAAPEESKPAPSPPPAKPPHTTDDEGERARAILEGRTMASAGSLVVQVGAFSDVAKASARQDELAKQGFTSHVETAGGISRVRVGPFSTRADAEAMLKKLGAASIDGVIATP